jgi:hypothetical protein
VEHGVNAVRLQALHSFRHFFQVNGLYSIDHKKKATPQKNVRFFSNFSWWFNMLPLLFELLNHVHKRPIQLGKGNKKESNKNPQASQQRPKLKSKKTIFFWGGGIAYQTAGKVSNRFPLRESMALCYLSRKIIKKPPGT